MEISKHKVVSLEYELKDSDGDVITSSKEDDPLVYLHGADQLVPGMEDALAGKSTGDRIQVTISPDSAFGPRDDELIITVPRMDFERPQAIEVGMRIELETPTGSHVATVTGIEGDDVTVDANHPLAGETLAFDATVLEVRDATEDELRFGAAKEN